MTIAAGAVGRLIWRGGAEDREFARGLFAIDVERQHQRARRDAAPCAAARCAPPRRASRYSMPGSAAANSSATVRSCTSEFCRRSSGARWKPNTSTARRSARSRPRARIARAVRLQRIARSSRDRRRSPPASRRPARRRWDAASATKWSRSRAVLASARIDAGDRAAIGLVWRAAARSVERSASAASSVVHPHQRRAERQFAAEFVQLLEIMAERARALQPHRLAQHLGGDERVAVAVAADPRADAQERVNRGRPRASAPAREFVLDRARRGAASRGRTCSRNRTGRWRPRRSPSAASAAACWCATAAGSRGAAAPRCAKSRRRRRRCARARRAARRFRVRG